MLIVLAQVMVLLAFASLLWLISLKVGKVSIVDRYWSFFFMSACLVAGVQAPGAMINIVLIAVPLLLWGIRLWLHITIRSFNKSEDARYLLLKRNMDVIKRHGRYGLFFGPRPFSPVLLIGR